MINNNNNNNSNNDCVTGVTRVDGTKGGEEGKGEVGERGEEGGEEILAHGRVDQSEVLADLKIWSICVGEPIVSKRL